MDDVWVDGRRARARRRVPRDAVTRVMGVMCVHKNNNAAGGDRLRVHVEDVFVGVGAGGGRRGTRARAARRRWRTSQRKRPQLMDLKNGWDLISSAPFNAPRRAVASRRKSLETQSLKSSAHRHRRTGTPPYPW